MLAERQKTLLEELTARNGHWFDAEMDKLEHWAEDRRASLKVELDELDNAIREQRKAARSFSNLPEKLELQRELKKIGTKRDEAWRNYDASSRDIEEQKDDLLDAISQRLHQSIECNNLFFHPMGIRLAYKIGRRPAMEQGFTFDANESCYQMFFLETKENFVFLDINAPMHGE